MKIPICKSITILVKKIMLIGFDENKEITNNTDFMFKNQTWLETHFIKSF